MPNSGGNELMYKIIKMVKLSLLLLTLLALPMLTVVPTCNAMDHPTVENTEIVNFVSELAGISNKEYLLEASIIDIHFSEYYGNDTYEIQIVLGNFNTTRSPLELFTNSTPIGEQVRRAVSVLEQILTLYMSAYNLSVGDLVFGGVYYRGSVVIKDGKITVDDTRDYIFDVILGAKSINLNFRFYKEKLGFIHILGHVDITPSDLRNNTELLRAILNRESLINDSLLPTVQELVKAGEKIFGESQENWFIKASEWMSSGAPDGYSLKVNSNSISLKRTLKVNFRLGSKEFTLNFEVGLCGASVKLGSGYDNQILIYHGIVWPSDMRALEGYLNNNTFNAKDILEKVLSRAKSQGLDINKFTYASFNDISIKNGDLVVHIYLSYGDPYNGRTPLYSAYYDLDKNVVLSLFREYFYGYVAPIEYLAKGTMINIKEDLNTKTYDPVLVAEIAGLIGVPIVISIVLGVLTKRRKDEI